MKEVIVKFYRYYGRGDADELDEGFLLGLTSAEASRYAEMSKRFYSGEATEEYGDPDDFEFSEYMEQSQILKMALDRASLEIDSYLNPEPDEDEELDEDEEREEIHFKGVAFASKDEEYNLLILNW